MPCRRRHISWLCRWRRGWWHHGRHQRGWPCCWYWRCRLCWLLWFDMGTNRRTQRHAPWRTPDRRGFDGRMNHRGNGRSYRQRLPQKRRTRSFREMFSGNLSRSFTRNWPERSWLGGFHGNCDFRLCNGLDSRRRFRGGHRRLRSCRLRTKVGFHLVDQVAFNGTGVRSLVFDSNRGQVVNDRLRLDLNVPG